MRGERLNDGLSAACTGEGPPLVILPGFGPGADLSVRVPRSAAWSNAALASGFKRTVHLIHRPVHPSPGLTIAALAGWHAAALAERFGEPVDVMGISAGGDGLRDLRRITDLEGQGRSGARIGSRLIAHGPLQLMVLAAFALSPNRPRAPGEAALVEAAQAWDVTARLGEIKVPVLVAGGTRDRVVPPELVRATAAGIAGARLVLLPGRGHVTALYDPRLKPAIAAFLAEPPR